MLKTINTHHAVRENFPLYKKNDIIHKSYFCKTINGLISELWYISLVKSRLQPYMMVSGV